MVVDKAQAEQQVLVVVEQVELLSEIIPQQVQTEHKIQAVAVVVLGIRQVVQ
jgi:hypothetical protein